MEAAIAIHFAILRKTCVKHGGHESSTEVSASWWAEISCHQFNVFLRRN
jgi:hypothetical protein